MSECLKCGTKMKKRVSLCDDCLKIEFIKMDNGDPSGYLYAAEKYLEDKKAEGK